MAAFSYHGTKNRGKDLTVMSETLIKAEKVSKKFCKNLKKSVYYGVQDIFAGVVGTKSRTERLRPGEFWALNDISFELKRGECLGVIGSNGSGKTTLLKILNGIISLDKGRVEIRGRVGALVEVGAGFHPMLTGLENIYINGAILGLGKKEIDRKLDAIIAFSELENFINMPVKHYSSGMYVRLGFAIASQMQPDILLIDEMLAVGDVGFRIKCYNVISTSLSNSAVVFVSHSMPEIARLCTDLMFLKKGKCHYIGDNISKGIDMYYSFYERPKGTTINSEYGEFLKIVVNNQERNNIPSLSFNDDLTIHITARVNPEIINPIFHVAILNQALLNICHCASDYTNMAIKSNNGIINLKVTIMSLTVRPGIYYLDFAITDHSNVKIIARTHLCHQIQVTGTFPGYGATLVMGEWEVIQ